MTRLYVIWVTLYHISIAILRYLLRVLHYRR